MDTEITCLDIRYLQDVGRIGIQSKLTQAYRSRLHDQGHAHCNENINAEDLGGANQDHPSVWSSLDPWSTTIVEAPCRRIVGWAPDVKDVFLVTETCTPLG